MYRFFYHSFSLSSIVCKFFVSFFYLFLLSVSSFLIYSYRFCSFKLYSLILLHFSLSVCYCLILVSFLLLSFTFHLLSSSIFLIFLTNDETSTKYHKIDCQSEFAIESKSCITATDLSSSHTKFKITFYRLIK